MAADGPPIAACFCAENLSNTGLYPIARQIERACGIMDEITVEVRRATLDALLGSLVSPETSALIADLLAIERYDEADPIGHLSANEKRNSTLKLLLGHYANLSQERGLVLVFEDIIWADASNLELIDLLIANIESSRILLIATYRPEFAPSCAGQMQVAIITLSRLSARAAIRAAREATADYDGMILTIVTAYGGRAEIIDAVRALLFDDKRNGGTLDDAIAHVTAEAISRRLYMGEMPDPDLIHPHERRGAAVGPPVVAKRLQRILLLRCPLASIPHNRLIARRPLVSTKEAAIWRVGDVR